MSARGAVYALLSTDAELMAAFGINSSRVWATQAMDMAPRKGPFLIIRWEETDRASNLRSRYETMTVWAHMARETSTDFATLDLILKRVEDLLTGVLHLSGPDGTITQIDFQGRSPDLNDEGYKTITKNSAFRVVSR